MEPVLFQSHQGTSSNFRKHTGATGNQAMVLENRQAASPGQLTQLVVQLTKVSKKWLDRPTSTRSRHIVHPVKDGSFRTQDRAWEPWLSFNSSKEPASSLFGKNDLLIAQKLDGQIGLLTVTQDCRLEVKPEQVGLWTPYMPSSQTKQILSQDHQVPMKSLDTDMFPTSTTKIHSLCILCIL